ncbi:MAG: hypothetical protein ABII13_04810 [Patescibacteria group bacterium]
MMQFTSYSPNKAHSRGCAKRRSPVMRDVRPHVAAGRMKMYIVTVDRPHYPSVDYFDDLEKAREAYKNALEQENDEGGVHETHVCFAEILETKVISTHY